MYLISSDPKEACGNPIASIGHEIFLNDIQKDGFFKVSCNLMEKKLFL